MDLKLKDKKALVTGASRGLGYATAYALAQEGAQVAINSRSQENIEAAAARMAKETGAAIHPFPADMADPQASAALIKQAAEAMGGLDILVTNAGGPPSAAFQDLDDQAWARAVDLSLMSHVRLIRAALPYLRKSQAASVLTITSISVKQPVPNLVLSNSVRSATIGLTKTLALELGTDGIRFNSILPSWTETERVTELMEFRAQKSGRDIQEEIELQSKQSPLGRMCKPEEFANAAVFLVSPAASYLTGVMLPVDGGMYKGTF